MLLQILMNSLVKLVACSVVAQLKLNLDKGNTMIMDHNAQLQQMMAAGIKKCVWKGQEKMLADHQMEIPRTLHGQASVTLGKKE